MPTRPRLVALLAPALLLALIALPGSRARALSGAPPAARTGAPLPGGGNELTCADGCHSSFALDSGPGSVTILAPADYLPGELVEIMVVVADSETGMRWGFQLTALDDALAGVGSLIPDALGDTQVLASGDREYIEHTSQGTAPGQPDSRTWVFDWQAPPDDAGPVTFYAVGNAANNGGGNTGDQIYSDSVTLPEPAAGAASMAALVALALRASRRDSRGRRRARA